MSRTRRLLVPLFLAAMLGALAPLTALAATDPGLGGAGHWFPSRDIGPAA